MTIFLALRNYYLRMALSLFMSKILFGYRNVQSIKWSFNTRFFRTISVKWVITWFKGQMDLKNFVFPKSTLGKGSIRYFGPVIWNSIPAEIRNANTLSSVKKQIRKWKPSNCQCRLCVDFLGGIGFTNRE